MKITLTGKQIALFFLAFLVGFLATQRACMAHAQDSKTHGPRMTQIGAEDVQHGGAELFARFLHDNETGQEVVCITALAHMDGTMACYVTGRKW